MQSTLGSADPQSLESAVAEPAESEWLAIGRICSCGTRRIRVVGDWSNLQLRNPQNQSGWRLVESAVAEPTVPEPRKRNLADAELAESEGRM